MRRSSCIILAGVGVLSLLPLMGCETDVYTRSRHEHRSTVYAHPGPPPHAPAHGFRRQHRYRYYPDSCVYYEPDRSVYFYLEGSNWRSSARLPSGISIDVRNYVNVDLDTDVPYSHFDEHKVKYPPHGGQSMHKGGERERKGLRHPPSKRGPERGRH